MLTLARGPTLRACATYKWPATLRFLLLATVAATGVYGSHHRAAPGDKPDSHVAHRALGSGLTRLGNRTGWSASLILTVNS